LQLGPHAQAAVAHLQVGAQVQGLHLQASVIGNLLLVGEAPMDRRPGRQLNATAEIRR
jgi:hypothetical protein